MDKRIILAMLLCFLVLFSSLSTARYIAPYDERDLNQTRYDPTETIGDTPTAFGTNEIVLRSLNQILPSYGNISFLSDGNISIVTNAVESSITFGINPDANISFSTLNITDLNSGDANFINIGFSGNAFGGNYYGTWAGDSISPGLYSDTNFATANYVSVTGDSNFVNVAVSGNSFLNSIFASGILNMGGNNITNSPTLSDHPHQDVTTSANPKFNSIYLFDFIGEDYLRLIGEDCGISGCSLTFDMQGANREIILEGNPTLDNWFDQDVKTTATGVEFKGLTVNDVSYYANFAQVRIGDAITSPTTGNLTIDSIGVENISAPGTLAKDGGGYRLEGGNGATVIAPTQGKAGSGGSFICIPGAGGDISVTDDDDGGDGGDFIIDLSEAIGGSAVGGGTGVDGRNGQFRVIGDSNTLGHASFGNGSLYKSFYSDDGDIYSENGKFYAGSGINTVAERYGVGLQVRENDLSDTIVFSDGADFNGSTGEISKGGATYVTNGVKVNDFLVVTDANDSSYIGSTGEVIGVEEEKITVSMAAAGYGIQPPDLGDFNFVIYNPPIATFLDNGDIHFTIGGTGTSSFKVVVEEARNDHAIHFDVNPMVAGVSGVDVDINGEAGAIASFRTHFDATTFSNGTTGTILDVIIDNVGASGGHIHALDVALSDPDNGIEVAAVGTHQGVNVIHQKIGVDATVLRGWNYDDSAGTYTDISSDINSDDASDITLFEEDNDALLIASDAKFDEVLNQLNTHASANLNFEFFYIEAGGAWVEFNPADDTTGYQNNGAFRFESDTLLTWGQRTINETTGAGDAATDFYWLKIVRTRNNVVTEPIENKLSLVVHGIDYGWDEDGNVSVRWIGLESITEPPTQTNFAVMYIDSADGDLKVKFTNGTVDTIGQN